MKPFKYCIITVLLFTAFSAYGQRAEELVAVWHSDSYVDSQFNYYYRVEVQNESQSLTITSLEVEVQFGERFPANKYNPRLLYTTKIIQVEIRPNSTK